MDVAHHLVEGGAWRDRLGDVLADATVHAPIDYLTALGEAGLQAEAWEIA
jgi:hypothetical protein